MSQSQEGKKGRRTRSLVLVLLAWVFIGGQVVLAAGNIYNYANTSADPKAKTKADTGKMPWELAGQGATKMRLIAMQARPDVVGNVAIFLAVANTLGLAALVCGLLSWSRSKYRSGKLTIVMAIAVILINSIVSLPYA
jgi:F0F1-type ATP synthase membrane subunit a